MSADSVRARAVSLSICKITTKFLIATIKYRKKCKKNENTLQFVIQIVAKYQTISFLESKLEKSLNARLDALYKWFVDELAKE